MAGTVSTDEGLGDEDVFPKDPLLLFPNDGAALTARSRSPT